MFDFTHAPAPMIAADIDGSLADRLYSRLDSELGGNVLRFPTRQVDVSGFTLPGRANVERAVFRSIRANRTVAEFPGSARRKLSRPCHSHASIGLQELVSKFIGSARVTSDRRVL